MLEKALEHPATLGAQLEHIAIPHAAGSDPGVTSVTSKGETATQLHFDLSGSPRAAYTQVAGREETSIQSEQHVVV